MFGSLPQSLNVNGKEYEIRSDFRSILRVLAAYEDEELQDNEKAYVCLRQVYKNFPDIPDDDYIEAHKQALWFIACGDMSESKSDKRTVDWEKDEQIMFPAINKVAGKEIRLEPYVHWWTFIGYLHSISSEDTYGYVLMLRAKRAKGKKFEKYETEFWNQNREMCEIQRNTEKKISNQMQAIYEALLEEANSGG